MTKVCIKCGLEKSIEDFHRERPRTDKSQKWSARCRQCIKTVTQVQRFTVLNHYGNRCNCCGETEPIFLTVDHINNDGFKRPSNERKYLWIIREGFPKDLQILCFNCNCGKARNGGICPHKQ